MHPVARLCLIVPALILSTARAANYYVGPTGDDQAAGTSPAAAFHTIARAVAAAQPGDTCWLAGGIYREAVSLTRSGTPGKPITLAAMPGQVPVLEGTDPVDGRWQRSANGVWQVTVADPVPALFCDGAMMTEARWPNCTWAQNWDPARKWALTDAASALGRIQSAAIARAGINLSGGLVYLKLSKGNGCYTRRITAHQAGSPTVAWDASGLPSGPPAREWHEDALPARIAKFGFANNRFFVVAAGALDAPEEWWYDAASHTLRFIAPDRGDPQSHRVAIQRRVHALEGAGVSDLVIRGLRFHACNLQFTGAHRIDVEDCRFDYPAMLREFPDESAFKRTYQPLRIEGDNDAIRHCAVAWALDAGLEVRGDGNLVEDCVVHDVNLDGRHPGGAITSWGANTVRRCTVYNCGGVGIFLAGKGPARADHNHVFNSGLYCVDVSAFYIPTGEQMSGTVVAYNWLHDHHGMGFRVDQFGRDITFHHNLVWNTIAGCKFEGTALTGYQNTVLADNPAVPFMVVFDPGADIPHWRIQDNVAYAYVNRESFRVVENPTIHPLAPRPGIIDHNVAVSAATLDSAFVDPAHYDFRPKPGGPLDGTGVAVSGTDTGAHPSVGALDPHAEPWIAGADWLPPGQRVPKTAAAATALARSLRPASFPIDQQTARYGDQ
ncbi:MAG TPA: right-handed parallel beta-helix repeat-containing protein [Opitutaceae bacterium]|nr:right-handed parallel beta-helix repeat-containing protein [Opitutaceae bacterium]